MFWRREQFPHRVWSRGQPSLPVLIQCHDLTDLAGEPPSILLFSAAFSPVLSSDKALSEYLWDQ